jgi:hypothetical protein
MNFIMIYITKVVPSSSYKLQNFIVYTRLLLNFKVTMIVVAQETNNKYK